MAINQTLETSILENEVKKAEILLKESTRENDKQAIILNKISSLENLLTAIVPIEAPLKSDFTLWGLAIHDINYRSTIEEKLLELVKQL